MSERYFCGRPIDSAVVRLFGAEAHHMLHVMRGQRGDQVRLFDGSGREFQARIDASGRDWVELYVTSSEMSDRELPGKLIVAVALPKGDRQKFLVEKLVELGVQRLIPLNVERSTAHPTDAAQVRLMRYAIEASKQCGRNRLIEVADAVRLQEYLGSEASTTKLIAHPGSAPSPPTRWSHQIAVAIGPEGGFTDAEVELAINAGWLPVGLGPRVLRTETAALFLAALASAQLDSGESSIAPGPRSQTT